jgi:hypothetical protein
LIAGWISGEDLKGPEAVSVGDCRDCSRGLEWIITASADNICPLENVRNEPRASTAPVAWPRQSTDTHGYIEDLFGLCYLLGYSFMPRIRDLADQQLYRIDRDAVYPNLAGIFRGGVDVDLIPEQWDQLVRVAASLKNRVCPAHVVMQRLANSSPSDRLAKVLTMLGRVVKIIYILKYFNQEDLRHRVQLQLNRGEHRHSLARWIFFADQGEFRTGDYQEIMNKASCLSWYRTPSWYGTRSRSPESSRLSGRRARPLPMKTWLMSPHCFIVT